jgi:hypothetical protein
METNKTICPGCRLELESVTEVQDDQFNASFACRQLYNEISAFTFSLGDPDFIHQLVVDSYAARHSGPGVKTITTAFALIGLYLVFEHSYTGREVQRAHMVLARKRRQWPHFQPPTVRSAITVRDVAMNLRSDNYRELVTGWAESVWEVWKPERDNIAGLLDEYLKS